MSHCPIRVEIRGNRSRAGTRGWSHSSVYTMRVSLTRVINVRDNPQLTQYSDPFN